MDSVIEALAAQQAQLGEILNGITHPAWHTPTRCEGWDVADIVLHLAQTDEAAVASAMGASARVEPGGDGGPPTTIDEAAAAMVELERGVSEAALLERWSSGAAQLVDVLSHMDLSTRVTWVVGRLSARTLATTRLAETWVHAGDVADALGFALPPTDRLRLIARLAWRTLPYAFKRAGRTLAGPVAFQLSSPLGAAWDFQPEEPAVTTIRGPAVDLCAVATRRVAPSATSLSGEGPDADAVLALVRTYA